MSLVLFTYVADTDTTFFDVAFLLEPADFVDIYYPISRQ